MTTRKPKKKSALPVQDAILENIALKAKGNKLLATAAQLRLAKKTREAEGLERQATEIAERLDAFEAKSAHAARRPESPKKSPK